MKRILVVDDEPEILSTLKAVLEDEGYTVETAKAGREALSKIENDKISLVLLDIWLPDIDGIEVLKRIKSLWPNIEVVMISGHGNIEIAVRSIKLGAYDYLEKPFSLDKVLITVNNALKYRNVVLENIKLKEPKKEIIGISEAMRKLKEQIKIVAPTDSWVLITGENGTGKELVAREIHNLSLRANRPFVPVNCAAIPDELIESELFGYEPGAFTGAKSRKKGKFDLADGGTLFLDEIGDMSLKTQAKILRILEEQKFERVGGVETINVDVRVIAATNKDLVEEIKKGNFREDLYFRLNVIPFRIPPLRERKEDIPLLLEWFLQHYCNKYKKSKKSFSKEAEEILCNYRWPGNVRELKNIVERLVIMVEKEVIGEKDLPDVVRNSFLTEESTQSIFKERSFRKAKEEFEKVFIEKVLFETNYNISKASEIMEMDRKNLYRKIKALKININKAKQSEVENGQD